MLLTVRIEQWRVHRLARSVPSNQRTPESTSDSYESTVGQVFLGQFLAENCLEGVSSILKPKTPTKLALLLVAPASQAYYQPDEHPRMTCSTLRGIRATSQ